MPYASSKAIILLSIFIGHDFLTLILIRVLSGCYLLHVYCNFNKKEIKEAHQEFLLMLHVCV